MRRASPRLGYVRALGAAAFALVATPSAGAVAPTTSEEPRRTPSIDEPPSELGTAFDTDTALAPSASPVASYDLSVRLDESTHQLFGTGRIHWQNTSQTPVSELYFHLYLNAFRDDRSLFLRSPFNRGRSGKGTQSRGEIRLTKLTAARFERSNLLPSLDSADSSDREDGTDVRVRLPSAVESGATLDLEIAWEATLPEIVERTGFKRDFHMVAQWFPKLARLEPSGAWAHFPFHAQSEFYADYGDYRVDIDVARSQVVGATGTLVSSREESERKHLRFEAKSVHDFAWVASPSLEERTERIGDVDVRVLFPPGYTKHVEHTLAAVRFGLGYYGSSYGRYPYPGLSVVIPPPYAEDAGGMEYPTLITTGQAWYTPYVSHGVELLTLHELGHQWFYGLVGTNEHAWPFLDEGLTSYIEARAASAWLGRGSAFDSFGFRVDADAYRRCEAASREQDNTVALDATRFSSFRELGALVYARTTVLFQTLGRVYGEAALDQALGRYARHYRYRHPSPRHLLAALQETLGKDAREQAERALFEGGWIDYAVVDVRTTSGDDPTAAKNDSGWYGRAVVKRRGTLSLPVDVDLIDAAGNIERRHLDGRARTFALEHRGPHPLERVHVDPDLRIPLDSRLSNNLARTKPAAPLRLGERLAYWLALALAGAGP